MIDSDGKDKIDTVAAEASGDVTVQDTSSVEAEHETEGKNFADGVRTDVKKPNNNQNADKKVMAEKGESDGVGETVGFSIKVAAVALSVIFLLIAILTVTLPFSAMKAYNSLGMYDRALESGERYINGRLSDLDAEGVDEKGNFIGVTAHAELSGGDFLEALDVCVTLSNKLMKESKSAGSYADAVYYAEKLERYTRMYACLAGVGYINSRKDSANIANVPSERPQIYIKPYVYSYSHTNMKLNFSARVVLGQTNYMMYNIGRSGDVMTSIDERLNTFTNTVEKSGLIDQYVDFIDQINAYLDYELDKLGLVGAQLDESTVRTKYSKLLDGSQFALYLTPLDGFTRLYNGLGATFTAYAQLAYDFVPSNMDERLRQLYQLQVLTTFSEKMSGIATLLYYNADAYGASSSVIIKDYPAWDERRAVYDGQQNRVLIELYGILMERYISIIQS